MSPLVSLVLIAAILASGYLVGRSRVARSTDHIARAVSVCLYALLFFMGLRIGESDAVRIELPRIGVIAAASAVTAALGTALAVFFLGFVFRGSSPARKQAEGGPMGAALPRSQNPSTLRGTILHLRDPLRLFGIVAAGFLSGYFFSIVPRALAAELSTWMLYLLLFLIGMQLARSGVDLRETLVSRRTLLVPIGAVVGSLASAALLSPVLNLPIGKALAVAAGFGWYSLSGVLITNMGDPVLGSAAFLANMLREGISLLFIPVLGRLGADEVAIGIAGATSMDVTLPLIERSCGARDVPLAVTSGAALSLLVPILVPLLFHVG